MAFAGRDRTFRPLTSRDSYGNGAMVVMISKDIGDATANTTTTYNIGAPPGLGARGAKAKLVRAAVVATVVPIDADGTVLGRLVKRDSSAGADVTVSDADLDLEVAGLAALTLTKFAILQDEDAIQFDEGDFLQLDIINNSAAIDTQATDMVLVAEFALLG